MASTLSLTDLRKMQVSDLEKDLQEKKLAVAKIRLDIGMMSQKDTSKYKKEKKDIARMLTVLNEKKGEGKAEGMTLKTDEKTATVRAPRASKKAKGSSTSSK